MSNLERLEEARRLLTEPRWQEDIELDRVLDLLDAVILDLTHAE